VRLKVTVTHQLIDRFGVRHQRARLPLIPQPVGMPDAVRTTQWTTLNVIQGQTAFAVLHDLTRTLWKPLNLLPTQQRNKRSQPELRN
jgi:hypothetical protein